jgi:hypothetical protein
MLMRNDAAAPTRAGDIAGKLGAARPGADAPKAAAGRVPRASASGARQAGLWVGAWVGAAALTGAVFLCATGFVRVPGANREKAADARPTFTSAPTEAALIDPSAPPLATVYLIDPSSCSALRLDRHSNSTSLEPCPDSGLALRLEGAGVREDLAGPVLLQMQAADLGGSR